MSIDELNQYNRLVKEFALAIATYYVAATEVKPSAVVDMAEELATEFMAREKVRKATNE